MLTSGKKVGAVVRQGYRCIFRTDRGAGGFGSPPRDTRQQRRL